MKQKKIFIGLLLVLTMISAQTSTINVKADSTANPTAQIDLNKTVEKNQWGLNEEFTVNYTIHPRDIPQGLVPEELYHKNGADISLVIDKSGSMANDIGGNTPTETTSYVLDTTGTFIKFDSGGIKYGKYTTNGNREYLLWNNNYYKITNKNGKKYINNNNVIDLSIKYKEVTQTEQSRMQIVKEGADKFIDKFKLYSNVNIGVVNFETEASIGSALTGAAGFNNVKNSIASTPFGGTNTGDALRQSYWQLKNDSVANRKKFIVLLTDGEPTAWNYSNITSNASDNTSTGGQATSNNMLMATNYAKLIAKNRLAVDNSNNVLNSFMIAFSKDAPTNTLAGISAIANNNKPGFYKEAYSADDLDEVYDKIAQTILSDLSVYGLQLNETFPTGIDIVDVSNGLKKDSTNKIVIGDIGNINYTLDTVNHVFKADPINFWVKLKGTKAGDYVLGKDVSTGKNNSFVSYKDIDGKDVNPAPTFPLTKINIYNNQPPNMDAILSNTSTNNYNLLVNVDKPSDIALKTLANSPLAIANKNHTSYVLDGTNYKYNLENIPRDAIENNMNSNIYSLSLEATDATNATLKTNEELPLTSVTRVKSDNDTDNILIQTDLNTTITEVKLNGNDIIQNDQLTDSTGKYTCKNVNLNDGNNVVSVTVINSYNNTTQTTTNINVVKSTIIQHGLYIKSPLNNVSEVFGTGNTVVSGIKYKAAVLVDQQDLGAAVTIDIGSQDTSVVKTKDDIDVTIKEVDSNGVISSVTKNLDCTKILNSDGSAQLKVKPGAVGRYLITYTFVQKPGNIPISNTATVDDSNMPLGLIIGNMPDLY